MQFSYTRDEIRQLSEIHSAAHQVYSEQNLGQTPLKELVLFGQRAWEITYKQTQSDIDAFNLFADFAQSWPVPGAFLLPDEQLVTMFCARWADQAFPRILVDGKYSSFLMATEAKGEVLEYITPPWKAFLIEFPEPILEVFCEKTQSDSKVVRIMVQQIQNSRNEKVWCYVAIGKSGVMLWRHGMTTEELLKTSQETIQNRHGENIADWSEADFVSPLKTKDERTAVLIGRLIVSICLSMVNPENFHEQKKTKGRGKLLKKLSGIPDIKTIILGKAVKLDCRPLIKHYMEGSKKSSPPNVRFMVLPHWRRVAYGPNRSLRRPEIIDSYWKGLDKEELKTRTVKMGNKTK